jgi:Skp family chaperone for outer membrane proteins
MKTKALFISLLLVFIFKVNAQKSNIRIGYVDTEYILENVPEYKESLSQLDQKVQKWKKEIDLKLREIDKKKLDLRNERILLTNELIEEKEEEIKIQEAEILDYQQKRFGPNGDLFIQKKTLIEPVQDQVLIAIRELAKNKKYDFIFDKSADVVMLFSNKRYDLSEYIIRTLKRTSKRNQLKNKKEKKKVESEKIVPVVDEELEAKQKAATDLKAEKRQAYEDRKKLAADKKAARKKDFEERRQKLIEENNAKRKAAEEKRKKIAAEKEAKRNNKNGMPSMPTENKKEE